MTHAPENATTAPIPAGFAPLVAGGPYIQHNGPLYVPVSYTHLRAHET